MICSIYRVLHIYIHTRTINEELNFVICGGYKFRVHKVLVNDVEWWVCTIKSCKSYTTVDTYGVIKEENEAYQQPADNKQSLMRQRIENQYKCKEMVDIFERFAKHIQREMPPEALPSIQICI